MFKGAQTILRSVQSSDVLSVTNMHPAIYTKLRIHIVVDVKVNLVKINKNLVKKNSYHRYSIIFLT